MWDGIPWFVEGTATSEETLRLVVAAAAGGGEGIVAPPDLVVTALEVPGSAVQVSTGAMIAARPRSGAGGEAYAARLPIADLADIEPTSADGPRSDLVIARIEDPYGGETWPLPEDPAVGPYVHTRVISDVPPGTTSLQDVDAASTAVTLARIDVPASTSVITQGMITDLRHLARPRSHTVRRYLHSVWPNPDDVGLLTDTWEDFPLGARWQEPAPPWATHVTVHAHLTGVLHADATEASVRLRVIVGEQVGGSFPLVSQHAGRHAAVCGHTFALPPADRGAVLPIAVQGIGTEGMSGVLRADNGTVLATEITYSQAPVVA
ncbi:hypothetical protein [Streptomyces sp. NRRL S-920]|uniref:hypothetical protein n=1 Tax=Streptomyces sp. NRRL S-920 TaxID=1463921 RepID=UPI0004CBE788|nr:hypothetical protein [Streptomyces sp. NRRL S-920]